MMHRTFVPLSGDLFFSSPFVASPLPWHRDFVSLLCRRLPTLSLRSTCPSNAHREKKKVATTERKPQVACRKCDSIRLDSTASP
jgi:hypothetical protein